MLTKSFLTHTSQHNKHNTTLGEKAQVQDETPEAQSQPRRPSEEKVFNGSNPPTPHLKVGINAASVWWFG
jgi:hypothetical protein